jgi:uncharacterized membrane protein
MKKVIFLSLVIVLIIGSCVQQENKVPQGAWKLVQSQATTKDSLGNVVSINYHPVFTKMWSEKNFSFIGQWKQDTIIRDFYGGGTYKLEGNRYEETEIYHWSKPKTVLNNRIKMSLELRNDTLIQIYPVDDNGQIDKTNCYVEKYIRLK